MQRNSHALKEVSWFFGLTLGLSFLVFWGPLALFKVPTISFVKGVVGPAWAITLFILGGFIPSLVGLILTWVREGRVGVKQLSRRVIQVKIERRWYLATLVTVLLFTVGQLLLIRVLGYSFDYTLFLAQLPSFVPLVIIGPLSEELGWRGYALDRLQTKFSALNASLIVGVAWGLWHFPLFYMVGTSQNELHIPFVGFLCGVTALSVLFTWLQNNTQGSLWTAVFFHWMYTYTAQVVATGVTRSPLYNWLEYLPHVLVALVVVAIWKPKRLSLGGANAQRLQSDKLAS